MVSFLATWVWDPPRDVFVVPFVNHPITWYGLFFAFGFFVGYFFLRYIFSIHLIQHYQYSKKQALAPSIMLADRLAVLAIIGGVFGARLGHVFFYGWPYYKEHLQDIFKVWEGGLASHGGAIGILIGLVVFTLWNKKSYPTLTLLALLDCVVIPAAFAAGCIRIGNFINQEILGIPTDLPWGVIFLHPIDGIAGIPLHPVQLYESFFYFLVCIFLFALWKKNQQSLGKGLLTGWFFFLVFGFRFFIEFIKLPQSLVIEENQGLNMGQILSIPFVLIGLILLITYRCKKNNSQPH